MTDKIHPFGYRPFPFADFSWRIPYARTAKRRCEVYLRPAWRSSILVLVFSMVCAWVGTSSAFAAGHYELTVVPLGQGFVPRGQSDQSYRLPAGPDGPYPQALVLIASQPMAAVVAPAPLVVDDQSEAQPREKVPATVTLTVGGKTLPQWQLFKFPTVYVINLETQRANPEFADGRIAIRFDVDTVAEGFTLRAFGMPDPLLVSDTLDGPLALFHQAAGDEETRAYFEAFAHEAAGNKAMARTEYRRLVNSRNEPLARLARRGLRMLSYDERPHKISGNFREHYYWGLYLQHAGVFSPAFTEFDEARVVYRMHADAQYRAGEMLDQIGGDIFRVMDFMNFAGQAAWEPLPTRWSTLIVILKGKGERRLSAEELLDLKAAWLIMRSMTWGATAGKVLPVGTILELDNEDEWPMIDYGEGIIAPARDIVAERGWYDSVVFVRPRTEADRGQTVRSVGGDVGPNGAGLSVLYHDASWREFMLAWYQQFTWAARVGEVGESIPLSEELGDCGFPPVPNLGSACRASLRYHFAPEMLRRVQMTPRPGPKEFVRLWRLEGPFAASSVTAAGTEANARLLAPLPEPREAQVRTYVSRSDFIDLSRIFPDAGPSLVRATCWVFSPQNQEVRMWLGRNDGAAVWINGRRIHQGRHFASGLYRDQNLVDTVAGYAPLRVGWNEVRIVVESLPAPDDRGWGFSLRFCDLKNAPVAGLAYAHTSPTEGLAVSSAPAAGEHYSWGAVRRNWSELLPRLTNDDLRRITGVNDLTLTGQAGPGGGVQLSAGASARKGRYRDFEGPWKAGKDRDVAVNNVLDWDREACAAIRYERGGGSRDLLLIKPEVVMAYLKLLKEPTEAERMFEGKIPYERLLGYVVIPTATSARHLFVVDCLMGEGGEWPLDEEDLLRPIAAEYIPNPPRLLPPYLPPQPAS